MSDDIYVFFVFIYLFTNKISIPPINRNSTYDEEAEEVKFLFSCGLIQLTNVIDIKNANYLCICELWSREFCVHSFCISH